MTPAPPLVAQHDGEGSGHAGHWKQTQTGAIMPKVSQKDEANTNGTTEPKAPKKGNGKAKAQPAKKSTANLPVVYPEVEAVYAMGEHAITVADAQKLLGWTELADDTKEVPQFRDMNGKPILCTKNLSNRPFNLAEAMGYCQSLLTKKWAGPNGSGGSVNGEAIIIGRHGSTLSAQKRLAALVFAGQIWAGGGPTDQSYHWKTIWKTEPVMDSIIVRGVDEDDRTVQTIDNVQPRSASDVIYTLGYFPERKAKEGVTEITARDRIKLCNMTENAVRFLWDRTGAKENPYEGSLTNAEFVDFLQRHGGPGGRLVQVVKHVWEENKAGGVSRFMSPGYAAALCYLMGCSASDGLRNGHGQLVEYADASPAPNEKKLNWERWDAAQAFWCGLNSSPDFAAVRTLKRPLEGDGKGRKDWSGSVFPESGKDKGSLTERLGALALAWAAYAEKGSITVSDLHLDYDLDLTDDEDPVLASAFCTSRANFGGIDTGGLEVEEQQEDGPSPEEVEKAKAEEEAKKKQDRLNEAAARLKAAKEAKQRKEAVTVTAPPPAVPSITHPLASRPLTAKEIQVANTEKARLADEELAKKEAAATPEDGAEALFEQPQ